ncbi:hypothetical protein PIB30_101312, partial [Stylosanthes scabra]|nr:hypothetical protein [Stylosanthes scabra]
MDMRKREERGVTALAKGKVVAAIAGATRESGDRRERDRVVCASKKERRDGERKE